MDTNDWFKDEKFWIEYAPVMFEPARWAEAPDVAAAIQRIAALKKGSTVLDAGCGPGRISVELALLGCAVTGVDLIKPYLVAAKDSAADEHVPIELVQADLRDFVRPQAFDAAINVYTSFGYCGSKEEDMHILKNIAASIKDGGWFILETTAREIAIKNFTAGEWFERSGLTVLTDFSVTGAWEGLRSRWIIIKPDGTRIDHEFIQRLYAATELRQMLYEAGFSSVEVYGDFDFSAYNEKARTAVLVCRKSNNSAVSRQTAE